MALTLERSASPAKDQRLLIKKPVVTCRGLSSKKTTNVRTGRPLPGPKLIVGRGWKLCGNILKETHSQRTAGRGSPN